MEQLFPWGGNIGRLVLIAGAALGPAAAPAQDATNWHCPDLSYRLPVTVQAGLHDRQDASVAWPLDFAAWLGPSGAPDESSIRVVALEDAPALGKVPFRFFAMDGASAGELAWILPGALRAMESRTFHVYFDVATPESRAAPPREPIPGLDDRPKNGVRNPGFEVADPENDTAPAEWSLVVAGDLAGKMELVQDPVRSGKQALKISVFQEGILRCRQVGIPMKPHTLYRIGAWIRGEPGPDPDEAKRMEISATLRRADGSRIEGINFCTTGGSAPPGRWRRLAKQGLYRYKNSFLTPDDTASCDIELFVIGTSTLGFNPTGTVYADDVEVVEIRPKDRPLPMAVEAGTVERKEGARR